MANELQTRATSGTAVYAILRNSSDQVYQNTTGTLVTFADGAWTTYGVPLTEQGTSGFFSASFPPVAADTYSVEFFNGSGTESDPFVTGGVVTWNGSAVSYATTGTALTTLAYVKDFAGITVTTFDSYLTNRLNAASVEISNYCNRQFPLQNFNETYDGSGTTTLLLNQRPITAVSSVTLGLYSGNPTVIPGSAFIINSNAGIISLNPSQNYAGWFGYDYSGGQQGIQVSYTAGYSTIPLDLQEVTAKVVFNQYLTRGQDLTLTGETIGDYSYTRRPDSVRWLTDDIQASLSKYRDFVV